MQQSIHRTLHTYAPNDLLMSIQRKWEAQIKMSRMLPLLHRTCVYRKIHRVYTEYP
jgi:hypothetical protein